MCYGSAILPGMIEINAVNKHLLPIGHFVLQPWPVEVDCHSRIKLTQ